MRNLYWLPEEERGNNCVLLTQLDWRAGRWAVTVTPGTANEGIDEEPDPATFVPDPDISERGETVADPAHFVAWLDAQTQTAATIEQHFASALLVYLWLQRKGTLPA